MYVNVVGAAAGSDHMVALSRAGNVYVWGRTMHGRLGVSAAELEQLGRRRDGAGPNGPPPSLDPAAERLFVPYLIESFASRGTRITHVACGGAHSVAAALKPRESPVVVEDAPPSSAPTPRRRGPQSRLLRWEERQRPRRA